MIRQSPVTTTIVNVRALLIARLIEVKSPSLSLSVNDVESNALSFAFPIADCIIRSIHKDNDIQVSLNK